MCNLWLRNKGIFSLRSFLLVFLWILIVTDKTPIFHAKPRDKTLKGFHPNFYDHLFCTHACEQTFFKVCIFFAVFVLNKSNKFIISKWVCVSPHSSFYQLANKMGKRLQLICCDNDTINPFYLSLSFSLWLCGSRKLIRNKM